MVNYLTSKIEKMNRVEADPQLKRLVQQQFIIIYFLFLQK